MPTLPLTLPSLSFTLLAVHHLIGLPCLFLPCPLLSLLAFHPPTPFYWSATFILLVLFDLAPLSFTFFLAFLSSFPARHYPVGMEHLYAWFIIRTPTCLLPFPVSLLFLSFSILPILDDGATHNKVKTWRGTMAPWSGHTTCPRNSAKFCSKKMQNC